MTRRIDATIYPSGQLDTLSHLEVSQLLDKSRDSIGTLFRNCALAVLNSGSNLDDGKKLLERYHDFSVEVVQEARGIRLELRNAPTDAFVDGQMIKGHAEHLFAVLRDIIYTHEEITNNPLFDLESPDGPSNAVFHILRKAAILRPNDEPVLAVCWGGHSINRGEYIHTKEVGYQLGLRGLDICTGCGPGAMKGPMKGATIAHAKQRKCGGRYIGMTEPGIIAAEPPNAIVNELVILPDIEKRLEAFVRAGHGIVVFPGGVGTTEEILYLLGILLHPDNAEIPFPLIFSGPSESKGYFELVDRFIAQTLGKAAQRRYRIVIADPVEVARQMVKGMAKVKRYREQHKDAFHFNWMLTIDPAFQTPFRPSHGNMRQLQLHRDQPVHQLAAQLRRAFSGIVAGNVKDEGIRAVEQHGLYEIHGDPAILAEMDSLLSAFVLQGRMKLPGQEYRPCYRIVR